MSTRYPRIREAYAGHALVRALDRVDALGPDNSVIQLIIVQYLDVLEDALGSGPEASSAPSSLLHRALDAVHEALDAFGLLEASSAAPLN